MSANSVPLAVNPDVLRPRYHLDAWALMELKRRYLLYVQSCESLKTARPSSTAIDEAMN